MKPFAQSLIVSAAIVGVFTAGWMMGAQYTRRHIAEETIQYFSKGAARFLDSFLTPPNYEKPPLSEDEKAEAELDEKFRIMKEGIMKGEIK